VLGRWCVLVTLAVNLDDAEDLDTTIVAVLGYPIVVLHVRWYASLVVLVVTSHRDLYTIVLMLDTYAHLVLAVVKKDLVDVFLRGLLGREELTGGVGVPFVESCDGVDYCILFHAD
jgi:hypothetical protein